MWDSVKKMDPNANEDCYWFDIFCLDQFHPHKMETIKRSNEIYNNANKYSIIGLACFDRLWCLAEAGCKQRDQIVMVFDTVGYFLMQRESAYKMAKFELCTDRTFEGSRCTVDSDRDIVRDRILQKFDSIASFNRDIKILADEVLEEFRKEEEEDYLRYGIANDRPEYHTFSRNNKCDKCARCGKLERLHHGKRLFCYDFLLDVDC